MRNHVITICVVGIVSVACTQTVAGGVTDEATATTSQAERIETEWWCNDCFEETGGGGPGTPREGGGSNGFVGGTVGSANGAGRGGSTRLENPGNCPPGTDCVEVHGDPRPLKDSEIHIIIRGREKGNTVHANVPTGRGIPDRIDPPCTPKRVEAGQCTPEDEEEAKRQFLLRECLSATFSRESMRVFCGVLFAAGFPEHGSRCLEANKHAMSVTARLNLCHGILGN